MSPRKVTATIVIGALVLAITWGATALAGEPARGPAPAPRQTLGPVLDPGHEAEVMALVGLFARGAGGYRMTGAWIETDRIVYSYRGPVDDAFEIVLRHPSAGPATVDAAHFGITFQIHARDGAAAGQIAAAVAREIVRNDHKDLWGGHAGWLDARAKLVLALLAVVLALGAWGRSRVALLGAIDGTHAAMERLHFPLMIAVMFTAAYLRFHESRLPAFDGGAVERLFIAYMPPLHNLLSSHDPRHPGLYFAIAHWPLTLTGFSVWHVRFVGLVFSVIAVLVAGMVVHRRAGGLGALLAMATVAVMPEFIIRSREITDLSLFMTLALAAVYWYDRAAEEGRRADRALFTASLGLALLSSFAALPVYAALAAHALSDRLRRRALWRPLLAAAAVGAPAIVQILSRIPEEIASKKSAAAHAAIVWGGGGLGAFAGDAVYSLFGGRYGAPVLALLVLALFVRRDGLKERGPLALAVAANVAFVCAAAFLRMKPYYAIFLPVGAVALLGAMVEPRGGLYFASYREYLRRTVPLFAALVIYAAFAWQLQGLRDRIYVQGSAFEEDVRGPVEAARRDGARVIACDVSHDKGLIAYHFFADPYESMANYYDRGRGGKPCAPRPPFAFYCEDARSDRALYALTEGSDPGEGWQGRAIGKLEALIEKETVHVIYNVRFENPPLKAFLDARCARIASAKIHVVYRCEAPTAGG